MLTACKATRVFTMQQQKGTYCKAANKCGHVVNELANMWHELLRITL